MIKTVKEENPTILHVGSLTIGKGQQAGFHFASGAMEPMQMIPAIKTHNEKARRENKPDLRMVVLNACESDAYAAALLQCVDFAIGHNSEVVDENAVEFSEILYESLFGEGGSSLAESFDMAKGCSAVDAYRLFGNCDATKFTLVETSTVSQSSKVGAASLQQRHDDALRQCLCVAGLGKSEEVLSKILAYFSEEYVTDPDDLRTFFMLPTSNTEQKIVDMITSWGLPDIYKHKFLVLRAEILREGCDACTSSTSSGLHAKGNISQHSRSFEAVASNFPFLSDTARAMPSHPVNPKMENISRFTREEMKNTWDAVAADSVPPAETMVCHYTDVKSAELIMQPSSRGFRASTVGQAGGGFYVVVVPPHEMGWEKYQGGAFRATVGRELWGEKASNVLLGGCDAHKLDVLFLIKVPRIWIEGGRGVPGRPAIRIIPLSFLYEHEDGFFYLQKQKIVKCYVLKGNPSSSPQDDVSSPEHAGIYFTCAVHTFYLHLPLKRQVVVETMPYSISLIDSRALQSERQP